MINRRGLITGLICLVSAPAIVRANALMPIRVFEPQPAFTEEQLKEVLRKIWAMPKPDTVIIGPVFQQPILDWCAVTNGETQ